MRLKTRRSNADLRVGFDHAERVEVKRRVRWVMDCLRDRQPVNAARQMVQISKILIRLHLGLR